MRVDGNYTKVHGPYPILMNVDGINIYTKAQVTEASDQLGRIHIWSRRAEGATNRT